MKDRYAPPTSWEESPPTIGPAACHAYPVARTSSVKLLAGMLRRRGRRAAPALLCRWGRCAGMSRRGRCAGMSRRDAAPGRDGCRTRRRSPIRPGHRHPPLRPRLDAILLPDPPATTNVFHIMRSSSSARPSAAVSRTSTSSCFAATAASSRRSCPPQLPSS